jgi:restriction endonuclease S subunit
LRQDKINWWKEQLKAQINPKTTPMDVGYVCRITELASRLNEIKFLLGYSTSQKITVNDFKKFIEYEIKPYRNGNAYYLVLCWVNNGMPDIQTFLDNLDKEIVAKVEPEKDDDMKDQTT